MTPEELKKLIRENRERLEADRLRQLHDREIQAMTQELDRAQAETPQPSDDELEKHAYEQMGENAQEVPVE